MDTCLKILYILMLKTPGATVKSCEWDDTHKRAIIKIRHTSKRHGDTDKVYVEHKIHLCERKNNNTHEKYHGAYSLDEYLGII